MRKIKKIIVHCSATKASQDIDASAIRDWHTEGNGWSDIGYHFVIKRDGTLEQGRNVKDSGAHCKGYNSTSIGICLVGGMSDNHDNHEGHDKALQAEFNFTLEQMTELRRLVVDLQKEYPDATLHGHNEFSSKACPCFDVKQWWKG